MDTGVTGVPSGQNEKNHMGERNIIDTMFRSIPYFPRDHLLGGRGSPRSRLTRRQPIVMIYDVVIETLPHELMAFRAVVEPRLMQAIRELTRSETPTAWSGMFQPGVTLKSLVEPNNLNISAYLSDPYRTRQPTIASE